MLQGTCLADRLELEHFAVNVPFQQVKFTWDALGCKPQVFLVRIVKVVMHVLSVCAPLLVEHSTTAVFLFGVLLLGVDRRLCDSCGNQKGLAP